jgi:tetratricopeptide (TPR) repeat protein
LSLPRALVTATLLALGAISALSPGGMAHAQTQVATDPVLAEAQKLIEQKRAAAAFAKLAPLEGQRAGEVQFDYWLGVAALEAGRLERAAIAFERALVVDPDFDSARLELGRTYLRMGSLDLAEQEFRRLEPRTPTPQGKQLLASFLTEIARLKSRQKFAASGFVELGGGRDNNISSTTADFTSAINNSFGLTGILPTGNSIKRSDTFAALATGGEAVWRYKEDRTFFVTAGARLRDYREFDDFRYSLVDIAVGHEIRFGTKALAYGAFGQMFRQNGAFLDPITGARIKNDRNSGGLSVDWRMEVASNVALTLGAQGSLYRYKSNPTQDTDQFTLSATVTGSPQNWHGSTLGLGIYSGVDRAKRPLLAGAATDVGRRNIGMRAFAQTDPKEALSAMIAVGFAERRDDDAFARASKVEYGRDRLLDVGIRATWRFAEQWSLVPYVSYVQNRSNIALYDFNKTEGGISVRYDF